MNTKKSFFKNFWKAILLLLVLMGGLFFVNQVKAKDIIFEGNIDLQDQYKIINITSNTNAGTDVATIDYVDSAFDALVAGGESSVWGCLTTDGDVCVSGNNTISPNDGENWKVAIGYNPSSNPAAALDVEGNVEVSGTITASNLSCPDCLGLSQIQDIYVKKVGDNMTGPLVMDSTYINLNRNGAADTGIQWYSSSYNAWANYMGPAGSSGGPKGNLTIPSGNLVTSWGLRSFIENSSNYGWTFESGSSSATSPNIVAEIRSSDGSMWLGGDLTVSGASTNFRNAIKAVDGSGSGIDADLLDSVSSGSFLRSDTTDNYTSGTLTFNSGTELDMASGSTLDINGTIALPTTGISGAGSGSGLDADLLDSVSSGSFLRSDTTDYLTSNIYFRGDLVGGDDGYRDHGVYGNYDSYKTDHIWSMGTGYRNAADGSDFGNLYGLAYKHTNNTTGGTMAGGHQMVWVVNGTGRAALGTDIWTSGNLIVQGGGSFGQPVTVGSPSASGHAATKGYVDGAIVPADGYIGDDRSHAAGGSLNMGSNTLSGSSFSIPASGYTYFTSGNVGIGVNAPGEPLQVGTATTRGAIRIMQVDDAVSDHLQFYNGSTRMGEIGTQDTSWLRINQVTAKNIYTPRYIRADDGFYVDGTTYGITGTGVLKSAGGATVNGALTVSGKLTAGEVDPPYSIDGTIYATYGHSTTGLKEETVGKVSLQKTKNKKGEKSLYSAELNFDKAEQGSDLWLFREVSAFGEDWNDLVVSLTSEGRAEIWYEFIPEENKLIIYGNQPVKVSYRLIAPRFDWPERDTNLYNQTGEAPEGVGIFIR